MKKRQFIVYAMILFFSVSVVSSLVFLFTGLGNYLLDNHAFRQTQTALTTFYIVKDGFHLNYITPILGDPWTIPFEFPIYQMVVALLKMGTSLSLDVSGRIISIMFFCLSLFPLYMIMRRIMKSNTESLLAVCFVLLHPIYLFWSRTFMIESTALFFAITTLWLSIVFLETKRILPLVFAVSCAIIASLVKITTMASFTMIISVWALVCWLKEKGYRFGLKTTLYYGAFLLLVILLPVYLAREWVAYSDTLKSVNLYAAQTTMSTNLNSWNFGTLDQKFSLTTWNRILIHSAIYSIPFYAICIAMLILAFILKLKYRKEALISVFLYLLAPAIFTNLYYVHSYYTYANSIFLCAALEFLVISFIINKKNYLKVAGYGMAAGVMIFFFSQYLKEYYQLAKLNQDYVISVSKWIKENTGKDDVMIVYGNDWGSEYAYYSERKTIALRDVFKSVKDPMFQYIIRKHSKYNITTLVFDSYQGMYKKVFVNDLLNYFKFQPIIENEPFFLFHKPDQP
ncbi:MAG: glycosyltransferase family 39 protein [Bacteroidetes bacterium]|nr:glycosyltransferase family 39 protein [Bacteroidota bacterium]